MEALTEVESEVIDVDDIDIDIDEGDKEACLVGRLVSEENCNPSNLIRALKRAWNLNRGMSTSLRELGELKLILFCFDSAIERDWVFKNQPWLFKGSLFAIKKFTRGNEQQLPSLVNVTVEHASFWARLYDVPNLCMNEMSLRLFTKHIGTLESVDKLYEDLLGKFLRFKISIDITKPLVRGISVRVKGKQLWLLLKYESLPSYCFSCGTIGHDHENCRSFTGVLRYNNLQLRAYSSKDTPTTLSHDIIENILLRLPVKYLIRCKAVCKLWQATISDPTFAETHLQQYKNSSSRSLLAWDQFSDYNGLYIVKILNNRFQFVSGIQHSREYNLVEEILCHYDGLYLKSFDTSGEENRYVLWNPSCRAYRELWSPIIYDVDEPRYGIYYNPLMKDYKVVIANEKHYAVFSCRYNKWSEVKEAKDNPCRKKVVDGVSLNGSFYWLVTEKVGMVFEFEIICFGWKNETFKELSMPDCKEKSNWFHLTSSGGSLCLFETNGHYRYMSIWKKVDDGGKDLWVEFKVQLLFGPAHGSRPRPVCYLNEGVIMLDIDSKCYFLLYDQSKNTFVKILKSQSRAYKDPVLYRENLFLL